MSNEAQYSQLYYLLVSRSQAGETLTPELADRLVAGLGLKLEASTVMELVALANATAQSQRALATLAAHDRGEKGPLDEESNS
jgi:hypothetical protein